jgi:hypothetical protein
MPISQSITASGAISARAVGAMALAAALLAPAVWAQDAPVRLRGTIERVDDGVYIVKERNGSEIKLKLAPNGSVSSLVPAALADIKPGLFIGVAGLPLPDGSQKALEVTILPEALRGRLKGFEPWDLRPESTMTNANVEATVASSDGHILTLRYNDGEKKIVVPPGIPIVAFAPGQVGDLKVGAKIFVGAAKKLPDGMYEASRIGVGKGIAPPM